MSSKPRRTHLALTALQVNVQLVDPRKGLGAVLASTLMETKMDGSNVLVEVPLLFTRNSLKSLNMLSHLLCTQHYGARSTLENWKIVITGLTLGPHDPDLRKGWGLASRDKTNTWAARWGKDKASDSAERKNLKHRYDLRSIPKDAKQKTIEPTSPSQTTGDGSSPAIPWEDPRLKVRRTSGPNRNYAPLHFQPGDSVGVSEAVIPHLFPAQPQTASQNAHKGRFVMVKVTSLIVAYQAITDPELRDLDMDLDQIRRDAASPNKEARRAS
ncbi:hypothetical protein C8J56DRAFT_896222 [Mycena floridula]|nr:hypothetical protein C8J56DRAFT_896222 [Mycena floridula]